MSNNCSNNCNCDDDSEILSDDCNDCNNLDCDDLDWNIIIRQITNCKIDECGKKRCKKDRIIEDRSHEQVCFWTQTIAVYLRYYGELSDGSGFQSFPLNQPLKFIASGNNLVVQATAPCVNDTLTFPNGVIIIPPCDEKPQRRPGECNKIVNFDEVAYYLNISSYDAIQLKVGTTIKAVNGVLVFEDHEIHCLCDLTEYQNILAQNTNVLSLRTGSGSASGSSAPNPGGNMPRSTRNNGGQ